MSSPIRRITWQGFRVPFRSEFATSQARMTVRDGLLVLVETGQTAGAGEASGADHPMEGEAPTG